MVGPASGGEPIAVGEQLMQLDQAITLTLQEIDENFSQAHQVITSRILPAIREYESACQRTWTAARFWKQFFEASAQVSLSHQPLDEADETEHEEPAYTYDEADATPHEHEGLDDSAQETHDSNPLQSPPRLSQSVYAPLDDSESPHAAETPFERLKRDVERSTLADSPSRRPERPMHPSDISVSMANDPSVTVGDVPKSSSPWKQHTRRRSSARPRVSVVGNTSTNPFSGEEGARAWDGIADLRTTPLRSAHTRRVSRSDEEDTSLQMPDGMSPPVTMQFSVPQSRYQQTPAREAARLVVDDLLRSVGGERAEASSPPRSARRRSVVGTPLTKRTPSRSRRDSLPTPPTITKVHRATDPTPPRSTDELGDDSVHVTHIPGMLDQMLSLEDRASGSDSDAPDDTEVRAPAAESAGSGSRSIEDDTLFGAKRTPSSRTAHGTRSLSDAVRRPSEEARLLGL
ncbi:hypothetical protein MOBT1_002765 [Malassezia obtusa]|uniref:DASH complex subunit ASK1 n=1 Tax=Malassezia obtusa TaxID=76774 RepID=A0AAF0E1I6_9BASI|nr:hypothetical protein MOBT1_002765 [Malassezia obtusa]